MYQTPKNLSWVTITILKLFTSLEMFAARCIFLMFVGIPTNKSIRYRNVCGCEDKNKFLANDISTTCVLSENLLVSLLLETRRFFVMLHGVVSRCKISLHKSELLDICDFFIGHTGCVVFQLFN